MNAYTSIQRVADRVEASLDAQARVFGHRRYGSALRGPATSSSDRHGAEQFRAAPFTGNPL